MPTAWHYTTYIDFLDHWQSLIAGLIALLAAGIAVFVTIRIERWKANAEDKDELLKEIRATNVANMVAFSLCNIVLGAKKQHIKPLKNQFDHQKELMKEAITEQQNGHREIIDFHADFRTLSTLMFPLSVLQTQIFEKISADGNLALDRS